MPQMASITVKKADGTTDIVYNAVMPSSGDKTPAVWRANEVSTIPKHRPVFSILTKDNGPRTARHVSGVFKFPAVSTVGGVETQSATVPLSFEGTLPTTIDAAVVKEAVYQFGNLLVAELVRAQLEEGYAAT